jgi:histidine triad (HIT) family protein
MLSNCIFCKIIKGDIPSATVYEDEYFKAIMDISPAAKGHIIILPKQHSDNLLELDADSASRALLVAQKIARAQMEELKCDGVNLLQNNGEAAGQTVNHFHIHLIPRYNGDEVAIEWPHGTYAEGEAAELAESIAKRINK